MAEVFNNSNQNIATNSKYTLEEERFKQNTNTRLILSWWVIILITLWLAFTGFVVVYKGTELSDAVMIALLTTTTANVIGLGFILLNGLFPRDCCG